MDQYKVRILIKRDKTDAFKYTDKTVTIETIAK